MKNSDSRFVKMVCLSFVLCVLTYLNIAVAGETQQTKLNAAKILRSRQKNSASLVQQHAAALKAAKNYPAAKFGVQTNPRRYASKGQMQTGLRAKPLQTPSSPLSYSALQKETILNSRTDTRLTASGADAAVPLNNELAGNASLEGTPQHANNSEMNAAAGSGIDAGKADSESSGKAQIFLVLIALCMALAGTAVILYLISKRSPQKEIVKAANQEFRPTVRPQLQALAALERRSEEDSDTNIHFEESIEEEDAVVELAQRYGRGQGEMQLLFSIQAHETEEAPVVNLLHASTSPKAKERTKRLAKKLGLGKSEVDLLMRLNKCGASANHSPRIL